LAPSFPPWRGNETPEDICSHPKGLSTSFSFLFYLRRVFFFLLWWTRHRVAATPTYTLFGVKEEEKGKGTNSNQNNNIREATRTSTASAESQNTQRKPPSVMGKRKALKKEMTELQSAGNDIWHGRAPLMVAPLIEEEVEREEGGHRCDVHKQDTRKSINRKEPLQHTTPTHAAATINTRYIIEGTNTLNAERGR
jgi:cytoskeletal protein RodZ